MGQKNNQYCHENEPQSSVVGGIHLFLTASEIRTKLAVGGLGTLHPWSQDEMKNRLNPENAC